MRPGPTLAARRLRDSMSPTAHPLPAVEWLTRICVSEGWFDSEANAREAAERWEADFLQTLRSELSDLNDLGRPAPYTFNPSSDYMIQGAALELPSDSQADVAWKRRRARLADYAAALRGLSPQDFEALCAGILELIGVADPTCTPYVADQGIDFYGKLPLERWVLPEDLSPTLQKQMSMWLIGQAKHVGGSPVGTSTIRELVGAVQLARSRAFSGTRTTFGDLEVRPCDAVVCALFTTGGVSTHVWRLIQRSGVLAMDGEMLAAFMAEQEVGVDTDAGFSPDGLARWVSRFRPT